MKISKYYQPILIALLVVDIILTIYLIYVYKKESFCNCFAAQYDGSEADPTHKSYYGGYCYDKEKITKDYEEGKYAPGV